MSDPVAGVVLAGGRSRRMGIAKPLLPHPDGGTFLSRALRTLSQVTSFQIVAGYDAKLSADCPSGVISLPDLRPGEGPLAGVEASLASRLASGYLIMACDQPLVGIFLLRRLLLHPKDKVCVFSLDDVIMPLPSFFPAMLLTAVEAALDEGQRSLSAFIRSQNLFRIPISGQEEEMIVNINHPEDYRRLKQS